MDDKHPLIGVFLYGYLNKSGDTKKPSMFPCSAFLLFSDY